MSKMELAYDLIARDKGASKALDNLGDSVDKTGKKAEGLSGAFKKGLAGVAVVAGAAGAALVAGLFEAIDREASSDKLAAQLGLDPAESKRLGKVAGDLYADAYGESFDAVNVAIGAVVSSIGEMASASDADLEAMTAKVLDLSTAFELDVTRAAQVAGQAVTAGLAVDATQALDLLTASMQAVPAAVREDLLDAIDEYGPFMSSIGLQGEEAFGLLVSAAEKGMFGIDKTGDALKEFTIRATDMSAASKVGYDELGLSQKEMSAKLLEGGEVGAAAFQQIVDGLLGMKDPQAQATAALALFGTPLEDLSVSEIPKFLASLSGAETALGDVEGAATSLGDTLNDNVAVKIETFKRTVQREVVDFLGEEVIPMIERNKDAFIDFGLDAAQVSLAVVQAALKLGAGIALGAAIGMDGLRVLGASAFTMADLMLAGFEKSLGWIPGFGGAFKDARAELQQYAATTNEKMASASQDMFAMAKTADDAAGGVGELRDAVSRIQSKRISIDADTSAAYGNVENLMSYINSRRGTVRISGVTSVGGITARASGGPVVRGRGYLVGEVEPELFVPNQDGQILNQRQMAAAGVSGSGAAVDMAPVVDRLDTLIQTVHGQARQIQQLQRQG